VAFPCAALADAETGRIAVYYGGADTVVCLAYTQVDELIDFVKRNSRV
jgi:beta-1,4-mannooligosaccharide/beta-1,4-mannosyl-N-acetylglucosamine phosphorylase